jgi:hypothetical protein
MIPQQTNTNSSFKTFNLINPQRITTTTQSSNSKDSLQLIGAFHYVSRNNQPKYNNSKELKTL